jgi:hypothetical protein
MDKHEHLRSGQRATKAERLAVMEALQEIWVTASESPDSVVFQFPDTLAGKKECRSLYDGLNDYRKKIGRKQLENFTLWSAMSSIMLCKDPNGTRVYFRKKQGAVSGRSLVILSAAARLNAALNAPSAVIECPTVRNQES